MITRAKFLQLLGLSAIFGGNRYVQPDDPWSDPDWLHAWNSAARHPITGYEVGSADNANRLGKTEHQMLRSIRHGQPVTIRYWGGSHPGETRLISPASLFTVEGFPATYVSAHCHTRNQPRSLRCDLIEVVG